ncbi:keratinocyte differentiation factor 1 [Neoarius graeffei]|uniref:keratinocyte differentiation factor 1 n=1 Tax=Neoarius graeffei TaxID=443677 RepID=UPI00298BCD71|nr:keratinocyte differentiation factor 1 [Neoarius graeffei]XP_060756522.1 keratinocyte differentiation factor 1 [Neoarius graeffei]
MPGHSTGTKQKSRPHTHGSGRCRSECYRPSQCSLSNQDSYRGHHIAKQESYRNQHNMNQDLYQDYSTDLPRLIDPRLPHGPPHVAKTQMSSYRDNHTTNHNSYRENHKTNQDLLQNHYTANQFWFCDDQDLYHNHASSPDRKLSQDSCRNYSTSNQHSFRDKDSHRDHCTDPPRTIVIDTQPSRGAARSCDNGLIPSAQCGSCSWSDCRTLICCILTCGFYSRQQPCVPPNESSTDPPPKSEPEPRRPEPKSEPKTTHLPSSGSFRYGDVYLAGKKVVYSPNSDAPARRNRSTAKGESQRPISNTSIYSREDLDVDDVDDGGTDIDSLITKKLLELYKLHQIEQLAKCTSDLSFSRKTNEISDLINSIAQDYNLEEQEAECRLVHGVIRISTRKYKSQTSKGYKSKDYKSQDALLQPNGRRDGTLPDSGNETMTFTFSTDEPEMLVSDLTPSDELARKIRGHSRRTAYSSGMAMDWSAEPLLC